MACYELILWAGFWCGLVANVRSTSHLGFHTRNVLKHLLQDFIEVIVLHLRNSVVVPFQYFLNHLGHWDDALYTLLNGFDRSNEDVGLRFSFVVCDRPNHGAKVLESIRVPQAGTAKHYHDV